MYTNTYTHINSNSDIYTYIYTAYARVCVCVCACMCACVCVKLGQCYERTRCDRVGSDLKIRWWQLRRRAQTTNCESYVKRALYARKRAPYFHYLPLWSWNSMGTNCDAVRELLSVSHISKEAYFAAKEPYIWRYLPLWFWDAIWTLRRRARTAACKWCSNRPILPPKSPIFLWIPFLISRFDWTPCTNCWVTCHTCMWNSVRYWA